MFKFINLILQYFVNLLVCYFATLLISLSDTLLICLLCYYDYRSASLLFVHHLSGVHIKLSFYSLHFVNCKGLNDFVLDCIYIPPLTSYNCIRFFGELNSTFGCISDDIVYFSFIYLTSVQI